ncbi:unnamed protein product, partial [Ectocarpus fasciculatus]
RTDTTCCRHTQSQQYADLPCLRPRLQEPKLARWDRHTLGWVLQPPGSNSCSDRKLSTRRAATATTTNGKRDSQVKEKINGSSEGGGGGRDNKNSNTRAKKCNS